MTSFQLIRHSTTSAINNKLTDHILDKELIKTLKTLKTLI